VKLAGPAQLIRDKVVAAVAARARIFKRSFIGGILCNPEPEKHIENFAFTKVFFAPG
jgi:hypothetical protein